MLGIYVCQEKQHGYMQTIITTQTGELESLAHILEECKDNKAGYGGGQATADSVAKRTRQHLAQGYTQRFESEMYSKVYFEVRYQHYDTYYCQPHLTFNSRAECVLSSAAFVTSITDKVFPKSPAELLTRLKSQRRHKLVYLDYLDGSLLIKPLQVVGAISAGV